MSEANSWSIVDSDNLDEYGIETFFFPGGEPHAKVPDGLAAKTLFVARMRTWEDVGRCVTTLDAITHRSNNVVTSVFIPYFPGARQDRIVQGHPYTLRIMTDMMTSIRCNVYTFDTHSQDGRRLIRGIRLMPRDIAASEMPVSRDIVGVISPDAGALQRALSFRNAFCPSADIIHCNKKRDPDTGQLSHYVMQPLQKIGKHIIVDDICDGGGTFNLLVEAFVKDPLAFDCQLEMFVSHGIFSKGISNIHHRIERIITTDSFCKIQEPGRLSIVPLSHTYHRMINGGWE